MIKVIVPDPGPWSMRELGTESCPRARASGKMIGDPNQKENPVNRSFQPARRRFLLGTGAALLSQLPATLLHADEAPQVPTIDERIRKLAADAPLSMTFQGQTAEECRKWQGEFAAKLRALLGPHQPPAQ